MDQINFRRYSIGAFAVTVLIGVQKDPCALALDTAPRHSSSKTERTFAPNKVSTTANKIKISVPEVDNITINGMNIPVGKRKVKLTGGSAVVQSTTDNGKKRVDVILQAVPPPTVLDAPPRAVSVPHEVPFAPSLSSANESPTLQGVISDLRRRSLSVPIAGYSPKLMRGSFYQHRGSRTHNAVDMLAPRNTPILAVESGTIGRLFTSNSGGLTIYQKSPDGKYVYYYAHLERYADNLHEGDPVVRNQVLGYVGTSGNAPPNTPHLHFAISKMDGTSVFHGTPIDPFEVYNNELSEVHFR